MNLPIAMACPFLCFLFVCVCVCLCVFTTLLFSILSLSLSLAQVVAKIKNVKIDVRRFLHLPSNGVTA